jgi:DNA-binding response OmpR family regulator
LEVGADDYMTKPFSMRELIARVKAMLRRVRLIREEVQATDKVGFEKEELNCGNLTIDFKRREAMLSGKVLGLKPKEYDLLLYFMQHQARALSRDALLEQVWGWDFTGDSRTVDVHIRWLREKIEVDPSKPVRIVTVRGAGYRFEG